MNNLTTQELLESSALSEMRIARAALRRDITRLRRDLAQTMEYQRKQAGQIGALQGQVICLQIESDIPNTPRADRLVSSEGGDGR